MRRRWRTFNRRLRSILLAAAATGHAAGSPVHAQSTPAVGTVTPGEEAAWDRARSAGSVQAFQRYLEQYPTGRYAEEAFRIIIEQAWSTGSRTSPAAGPSTEGRMSEAERAQMLGAARGLY